MPPSTRRQYIIDRIEQINKVYIEELAVELNVSPMTIRRDFDLLENEGKVLRIHGGAVSIKPLIHESSFNEKESRNIEQKQLIARKAFSYVKDGQTIILDSGTTTLELAKLLKNRNNVTVITNDIKIAVELINSNLKVHLTGGELQINVGTLFGAVTQEFLSKIYVDIFFMGAHAINLSAGIMSTTHEKSCIKQLMLKAADNTWLLADSSKLNQKAFSKVCEFNQLTGIITDNKITTHQKENYEEMINIL